MKMAKKMPKRGIVNQAMDPEDMKEPPETPGEKPDPEDLAEGPETEAAGPDTESAQEDANEPGEEPSDMGAQPSGGDEGDQPGEQYNASPEEQKQYDALMVAAMQLIYNKDRMPVLLQKLAVDAQQNLSKNVGTTAANIMQVIVRSLEKDHPNVQVDDDVLMNVGADIVSELMEVAVAAGICPEEKRDMISEAALYEGMNAWGKAMEAQGKVTPELQADYKQTLAQRGIQQQVPQQGQPQGQPAAPAASPAPPQGGIVNQAMGAQQ